MSPVKTLDRNLFTDKLEKVKLWDIIIIGGGATGLGIAVDAANRGYSTLLLEQSDFAKGTSSRSTKLVHGGVRYLAQGNIGLVIGALRERGILLKNAPHLVKKQSFIIPCYSQIDKYKYLIGLKLYDWLAGRLSFGRSRFLSKAKVVEHLPGLKGKGLVGGIEYYDGQFDDARLAVNLAQTSAERGGVLLNYFKVNGLLKAKGRVSGVVATDLERNKEYRLQAKVVVNATGVFVDEVLQMDQPEAKPLVRPSQGIHLVFHRSFLNSQNALMIPKTSDGRVLFAVPWHDYVLVGTTDTPLDKHSLEPVALQREVSFIFKTIKQYMTRTPGVKDVLSVYAGLRPLAAPQNDTHSTKEISRDHKLMVSASGLITITGGKWTTYRKMAEESVNKAIQIGKLKPVSCTTRHIPIHGGDAISADDLTVYGTDEERIRSLAAQVPGLEEKLLDHLPYTRAEVVWAVRYEMARTVEDILARRLRVLFLDAAAAMEAAPRVAAIMAEELGYGEAWIQAQVEDFTALAAKYLLSPLQASVNELSAELI